MNATDAYDAVMADDRLPSPGAVALELQRLTRDPDAALEDVARQVAMDPAICARVLRAVNSAATGARPIVSVDQAVMRLGMKAVARVALEVSVLERSRTGLPEFDYGSFWAESLARAVAARVLAGWTKHVPADEAFSYGLLANVGRLALVSVFPQQYRDLLLTLGAADRGELADAERAVFDIDAEQLSARMLAAWGLPSYLDALLHGAGDGSTRARRAHALLGTCRVAASLARVLVETAVTRGQLAATMQAAAGIGVGNEVIEHLFPDIVAGLHETGELLQIPTRAASSLADVYAHAIDAS